MSWIDTPVCKHKNEAIARAKIVTRSKRLQNPKAIYNLGQFAQQSELFHHVVDHDDWEAYLSRWDKEQQTEQALIDDPAIAPKEVMAKEHEKRVQSLSDQMIALNPFIKMASKAPSSDNPLDKPDPRDSGRTKLHKAVIDNDSRTVQQLLEDGADPFTQDENGRTPLGQAQAEGYKDIAEILRAEMRAIMQRPSNEDLEATG